MKAFLIDPFKREITEVEHNGDYTQIYELIECRTFDAVYLDDGDCIFVDDEGLFAAKRAMFKVGHSNLANKGLVLGSDKEGETVAAKISLDTLKEMVSWPDAAIIPGARVHKLNEDLSPGELLYRGEPQIVSSERD